MRQRRHPPDEISELAALLFSGRNPWRGARPPAAPMDLAAEPTSWSAWHRNVTEDQLTITFLLMALLAIVRGAPVMIAATPFARAARLTGTLRGLVRALGPGRANVELILPPMANDAGVIEQRLLAGAGRVQLFVDPLLPIEDPAAGDDRGERPAFVVLQGGEAPARPPRLTYRRSHFPGRHPRG